MMSESGRLIWTMKRGGEIRSSNSLQRRMMVRKVLTRASSGSDDADFVGLMLAHHRAAINMAVVELAQGKEPQMRRLAQEIIIDQQSEIDLMQLWLKQHGHDSQK
jgi:uncharacterized protein (DUF305 family)